MVWGGEGGLGGEGWSGEGEGWEAIIMSWG